MFFLPTCESVCAPNTYFNTPQVFMIAILQMCWSRCTSSSILHFSRTSWHMRGVHVGRLVTNMIDWLEVLSIEISVNWSIRVPDLWKTTKMFAVQHLGIQFFAHVCPSRLSGPHRPNTRTRWWGFSAHGWLTSSTLWTPTATWSVLWRNSHLISLLLVLFLGLNLAQLNADWMGNVYADIMKYFITEKNLSTESHRRLLLF